MLSIAEAKLPLGVLIGLIVLSLGLKAALGPETTQESGAGPRELEEQLARRLIAQGFSTRLQAARWQSPAVVASRGDCRLIVRDASLGGTDKRVYAQDAAHFGRVRYLFAGEEYDGPPAVPIVMARMRSKLLRRLALNGKSSVAVALATSPGCGGSDFGLGILRVGA